jgi:hypothetical protein
MWGVVTHMKINKIIGKPIYFIDRNGAWRISIATSVVGNTITVTDAVGGKERLHPTTSKIFGVVTYSKEKTVVFEEIEFNQIRMGKKLKNKVITKEINAMKIKPLRTKRPRAGRPSKVK